MGSAHQWPVISGQGPVKTKQMGTEAERPKERRKVAERCERRVSARARLSFAMIGTYHHSVGLEVRENIMAIDNYLGDTWAEEYGTDH